MLSLQTGIPAITFNPSGTNFMTNGISNLFKTGSDKIDSHIVNSDPLNLVNNLFAPFLGNLGRPHIVSVPTLTGTLSGHSLTNFNPQIQEINPITGKPR